MSKSNEASWVATRTVGAQRPRTRRRCRRARASRDLAVLRPGRRRTASRTRRASRERCPSRCRTGGPRGTRRWRLWQRHATDRPRTAPKATPKRRKNWVCTPRAPRTCPRAAPAVPRAAHVSGTGRRASTSSARPPRSPACRSRANGVDAPRGSAVRREDVGAAQTATAHRSAPLGGARSRERV